ncbi:hypothetical protein [Pseudoduganella buxea]|uniref:Uncharacterized protein n=1 Tax=Pseudoduganella buxea TaxID=1949069 RepID=A0A6I3T2S2_9BURK|nr:hypothetical protein [Pseudoduganella buxea]MTV53897.1 hypothetical protein [Pseudoduganella buxea]GGC03309.1 hypothetical protein GCM10011572_26620 [Pseudoduganella buxea]
MKRQLAAVLIAVHALGAAAPVVEVSGIRDPELKSYRTMARGLDAFDAERAHAPQASLRFLLRPAAPGESLDGLTLTISGESVKLPVTLAADGGFELPRSTAALEDKAELVLNRKRHSFRWRPDVRSPGVPANTRRLGDLRLQCAVQWAIDREALTPQARAALGATGGPCHSPLAHTGFEAPQPLRAAWLRDGTRREALPVNRQRTRMFTPPLADRSWSDDALVEFDYAGQPAS